MPTGFEFTKRERERGEKRGKRRGETRLKGEGGEGGT
jgi:hypothetical protein